MEGWDCPNGVSLGFPDFFLFSGFSFSLMLAIILMYLFCFAKLAQVKC